MITRVKTRRERGSRHEVLRKCQLCGYEFSKEDIKCSGCPLGAGRCSMVCCPNCKYQFPAESKLVNIIRRIFKRNERRKQD